MAKKMDGCARFDDRIPIEYTPKEFYDELIAVQSKFQSKKILNYIEDQIITELGKDNLDLINNFGEIKKFRQYYTEHLVYEYCKRNNPTNRYTQEDQKLKTEYKKWFKPFKIKKNESKNSRQTISRDSDKEIASILQNIKIDNKTINDIISYSTIPGLFSYFLTDKDNNIFINQLDKLIQQKLVTQIKIVLKGVFKMPTFLIFLKKIFYKLFVPYICNEKPFTQEDIPLIYNEIIKNVAQSRSYCPQIIKDIISHFKKEKQKTLCATIFKECLFDPLQKDPCLFMCSDFPSFEMNRDFILRKNEIVNISENRIYRNFFNVLFQQSDKNDKYDIFVIKFIDSISDKAVISKNTKNKTSFKLELKYLYQFDIDLIKSKEIDYKSVITNFSESLKRGEFCLYYFDNINDTMTNSLSNENVISHETNASKFDDKMIKMIQNAPILKPMKSIPYNRVFDIIKEYLINKNDPLLVGRDLRIYKRISEIWNNGHFDDKFPRTKQQLHEYFNNLTKNIDKDENVVTIKHLLKEKGNILLTLRLTKKALKNWKYFLNNMTIHNLIRGSITELNNLQYLFPRSINITENPDEFFRTHVIQEIKWFLMFNDKYLNKFLEFNLLGNFQILVSGFFLNCNLKYYDYIIFKRELSEIDKKLFDLIYFHVSEYIKILKEKSPVLYSNTFGSSSSYFSEDVIRLRTAFDANVDPHRKIALIRNSINHAINKMENQFIFITQNKNKDFQYKLFIDILLIFTNPRNLFSNIVFMMEYEVNYNYSNSIRVYFDHFLNFLYFEKDLLRTSRESIEYFTPSNYLKSTEKDKEPSFYKKSNTNEKNVKFVCKSETKLSLLLSKIIPFNIEWEKLDNGGKIEFKIKKDNVFTHCIFEVDSLNVNDKIDLNGVDIFVFFFDKNEKSKEIEDKVLKELKIKNCNVIRVAIYNLKNSTEKLNEKNYKSVFDHVFEFNNDALNKK